MPEPLQIQRFALGAVAVSLGALALFPGLLRGLLPFQVPEPLSVAYRLHGFVGCPTCLGGEATQELTFDYPQVIRLDESRAAILLVDPVVSGDSLSASLSGPNFKVKPSEFQEVPLSQEGKTKLSWLLQPEKIGQHVALLDISQLVRQSGGGMMGVFFDASRLEGPNLNRRLNTPSDAVIELPIRVVTMWGISNRSFQLLRAFVALAAFVLATPLAYNLLRHLFRADSGSKQDPDTRGTDDGSAA